MSFFFFMPVGFASILRLSPSLGKDIPLVNLSPVFDALCSSMIVPDRNHNCPEFTR